MKMFGWKTDWNKLVGKCVVFKYGDGLGWGDDRFDGTLREGTMEDEVNHAVKIGGSWYEKYRVKFYGIAERSR